MPEVRISSQLLVSSESRRQTIDFARSIWRHFYERGNWISFWGGEKWLLGSYWWWHYSILDAPSIGTSIEPMMMRQRIRSKAKWLFNNKQWWWSPSKRLLSFFIGYDLLNCQCNDFSWSPSEIDEPPRLKPWQGNPVVAPPRQQRDARQT